MVYAMIINPITSIYFIVKFNFYINHIDNISSHIYDIMLTKMSGRFVKSNCTLIKTLSDRFNMQLCNAPNIHRILVLLHAFHGKRVGLFEKLHKTVLGTLS